MVTVTIKRPNECSADEKKMFVAFVRAGGEIFGNMLPHLVETAECIVQLFCDDQLGGTAALKNPSGHYRHSVFSKAKAPEPELEFPFELGYVVVHESLRGNGFSHLLVAAALTKANGQGIYATSELTKEQTMHSVLQCRDFERVGQPYPSSEPGRELALFIRPARKN